MSRTQLSKWQQRTQTLKNGGRLDINLFNNFVVKSELPSASEILSELAQHMLFDVLLHQDIARVLGTGMYILHGIL